MAVTTSFESSRDSLELWTRYMKTLANTDTYKTIIIGHTKPITQS